MLLHAPSRRDLRIGMFVDPVLLLPRCDRAARGFEGGCDARLGAQRLIEERLAEVGPFRLVAAAEGFPVGAGGGNDDRALVLECADETAGVARGDNDDTPLDPGIVEGRAHDFGRQIVER